MMFDYDEEQLESQNAKLVRLGECLTLFIVFLVLLSILLGLDARSMAMRSFDNAKLVDKMSIFYFLVGIFPVIYLYIEDRRFHSGERQSKIWYMLMAGACLAIWAAIGWIMGFKFIPV